MTQDSVRRVVCPVCGCTGCRKASFYEPLYSCLCCGLIQNLRSASTHEEESRYQQLLFDSPASVARQQFSWMERECGRGRGRVLDLGCGSGSFLGVCQKNGWKVSGLDLSRAAIGLARQRLGPQCNLHCGPLETFEAEEAPDLITLWDVLDHLEEPRKVLRECERLLQPGGWLLIRVRNGPVHLWIRNLEFVLRKVAGSREHPHWSVIHRFGFSVGSLCRLVLDCGYTDIEVCAVSLMTDQRDRATGLGKWVGRLKNWIAPGLSWLGRLSCYRLYLSTSIMIKARRDV